MNEDEAVGIEGQIDAKSVPIAIIYSMTAVALSGYITLGPKVEVDDEAGIREIVEADSLYEYLISFFSERNHFLIGLIVNRVIR